MLMDDFLKFRNSCLDYLHLEKALIEKDIADHEAMSESERESLGLLIRNARLVCRDSRSAVFSADVNNTKLRAGDEITLFSVDHAKCLGKYTVDVNAVEELAIAIGPDEEIPDIVNVEVNEFQGLDVIIKLLGDMRPGSPGVAYVEYLSGVKRPALAGLGAITEIEEGEIPESFNEAQVKAVKMMACRPKLAYVQGTPGSGKTHLLAIAAKIFAMRGQDVAIVALTHQAVNNALNKAVSVMPHANIVKIGKVFKNEGLSQSVERHESFSEYVESRKRSGRFIGQYGHIVGMSFLSAIANLGLRKSAFMPQVLLFDEAGQMPLTHASVLGAFKCGSIVLIGDDRQMPPIYHKDIDRDALSRSVFEVVKGLYPDNGIVLDVTYRMNSEITRIVGDRYYSPYGVSLSSDAHSVGNVLSSKDLPWRSENESSFECYKCDCPGAADENSVEADKVVDIVSEYLSKGLAAHRMAVITPYRRQVRLIHAKLKVKFGEQELPMVDTVERLQGQDVELIIASFAASDPLFFASQKSFLMNENRLNVMFSRATSKIIVVAGSLILDELGFQRMEF